MTHNVEISMMASPIRVLITDDHLIMREGLRMILGNCADIQVVGEAENGLRAIELAEETQPDVILMDLQMPGLDGLSAMVKIKAQCPEIAIVLLTTYNEDDLMIRGLQAGAKSVLFKDTDRDTLLETIRAAFRGATLLRGNMLSRVLRKLESSTASPHDQLFVKQKIAPNRATLSQRETEILKHVARGARNKEIAGLLNIGHSTVKAHLDSIFNKWNVNSRAAAVSKAIYYGFLPD